MKKKILTLMILGMFVIGFSNGISQSFEKGNIYHGFKLNEKKFVKEVNAECYLFEHVSSGATLIKIASGDANKTFAIAFKTDPESDAGTPHIMEHCVLNGSKKFPVKSPFDVLVKGSLNTFINAFTGADRTMYPVASMNYKDYFNLMDVYLDAVFNPRIYDDPRILKQEGWHHELISKDEPVVYRGIVYNEMKGAYSSPERELSYLITKNLFPDNSYRFSSGGYPPSIPDLTYEAFINYHKKYYHPTNSYIVLYGDADLNEELKFIDENYLKNYTSRGTKAEFSVQKPFSQMKEVTGNYSVTEGAETDNQSFLSLSYVTGLNSNQKLTYALFIIGDVLIEQETAPIRKALEEAGIGKEISFDFYDYQQNIFSVAVQNANPSDKVQFRDIIIQEFHNAAKNGLDKEAVEGSFNRLEFHEKEMNSSQLGLSYAFLSSKGWQYADDPFLTLEYEKVLNELKSDISNGYLESVIDEYLVRNNHAVLTVLNPEPGLESKKNMETGKKLLDYKNSLSEQELENIIKETNDLIQYQQEEDSKEAIATIPLLDIKDIEPKAKFYEAVETNISGIKTLKYEAFTNNVVYLHQFFDMRVLPMDLIQYAPLLAEFIGSLSTENYSYGALEKNLNIHTGGFTASVSAYFENQKDENMIPKFVVGSKAMNYKTDKMLELAGEIIANTKYDDKERIKSLLIRLQSNLEANVKSNGYPYAITRLKSYFTNDGQFEEYTRGLEYYWFITDLTKNFDAKYDEISSNLKRTAGLLFNKNNLTLLVTAADKDYKNLESTFGLYKINETETADFQKWNFKPEKKNEGFLTASKVQYVIQGYDLNKLGVNWNGKLRVLNQILHRDYLYNTIRVIGGAYGGVSSISPNGQIIFSSYRDPNLKKTFENFNIAVGYLKNFNADNTDMTRYIIGTVARMDLPMTPNQEGNRAFRNYLEKSKKEDLQKDRDEILSCTAEDIRNMAGIIEKMLNQNYICVYGSEDAVNQNKDLFMSTLKIIK